MRAPALSLLEQLQNGGGQFDGWRPARKNRSGKSECNSDRGLGMDCVRLHQLSPHYQWQLAFLALDHYGPEGEFVLVWVHVLRFDAATAGRHPHRGGCNRSTTERTTRFLLLVSGYGHFRVVPCGHGAQGRGDLTNYRHTCCVRFYQLLLSVKLSPVQLAASSTGRC